MIITLPCQCPEPDCGTYLQRALQPDLGVSPHYQVCHPGVAPPPVMR